MKIKNLMSFLFRGSNSKSFYGISVLMFVAFFSFSTSVSAQNYVSYQEAAIILKQETQTAGQFKFTGQPATTGRASKAHTSAFSANDYAIVMRVAYVQSLFELIELYQSVGTAIEVNNANWVQQLAGSQRSSGLPVLKVYVTEILTN